MSKSEEIFLKKMEKHKGVVFKISKMYMDNKDDQDDLFQEIIYQAWKSFENFEGKSEFSTWLYKIALNTAIIFLKSAKRRNFIENKDFEKIEVSSENYNDATEANLKIMYHAIHQLNPIDKALIFYYLENYSGKQISEQMGITEVNVRVKLNRAKTKLKELISQLTN